MNACNFIKITIILQHTSSYMMGQSGPKHIGAVCCHIIVILIQLCAFICEM